MGHSILIIDDSKAMRQMIARTVRLGDIEVDEIRQACNGKEALEEVKRKMPNLAILDINMPVMDGEEFLAEVRSTPGISHLPVVVVSTETNQMRIRRLRLMGAQFVHKPFHSHIFCDAMHRAAASTKQSNSKPQE